MAARHILATVCLALTVPHARAADPYPYVGVYSILSADFEKNYGMTKYLCLASLTVQRADGSYTAYHINMQKLGVEGIAQFHPYETGTCEYSAAKKTEDCKVQKSNWGQYRYFIEHRGEADGAEVQAVVDMRNPGTLTISNMRKCPFDETRIKPHLSEEWLNYSDDDISWVFYRYLPFNPDLAAKAAKNLGLTQ